jgi:hypothetical protein
MADDMPTAVIVAIAPSLHLPFMGIIPFLVQ